MGVRYGAGKGGTGGRGGDVLWGKWSYGTSTKPLKHFPNKTPPLGPPPSFLLPPNPYILSREQRNGYKHRYETKKFLFTAPQCGMQKSTARRLENAAG